MRLNNFYLRFEYVLLIFILVLGFLVRLYRFDNPIADWHSWRQADTSSVSRNFVTNGFDLLHPTFDDLSNVPTGIYDNPKGYRFVEFPIYNALQALSYKAFGILTLEEWGRLVSIVASLVSSVFLYLIVKKRFGPLTGFFSSFFFLFLPFNIYYSRTILPDPLMVTASLGSIYFFQKWIEKEKDKVSFWTSLVFLAVALLLKPYAIFFAFPQIYLAYEKFGKEMHKNKTLWIYAILSVVPLGLWRVWMLQYPAGIPQSSWLLNGNGIRFRPSFFYWIIYKRVTELILGFFGVPLLIFGLIRKESRKNLIFVLSFIFSSAAYVTVIATGNVQHDYYQILVIPSVALVLGLGVSAIQSFSKKINEWLIYALLIIIIALSFGVSWNFVKDYFNINDIAIVHGGEALDKIAPKNAKVIANLEGDTSFLYQTKRSGWPSFEKPVPQLIKMGASYLLLVNPTPADLGIGKTYKIVALTKEYVIFDLLKKP